MTDLKPRCFECRKLPKNCTCYEYRLERAGQKAYVYGDQICMSPLASEDTGTYLSKRKVNEYARPVYEDGLLLAVVDGNILIGEVSRSINNGTFSLSHFADCDGFRYIQFDKDVANRLAVLRKEKGIKFRRQRITNK